jgi:hypothetical protein
MNRSEHIAGLEVERLTPPDIEYFFRTLHSRIPRSTSDATQHVLDRLRSRLRDLAVYLGEIPTRDSEPKSVENVLESISHRLERMKRRQWRTRIDGLSVLKQLRVEVGEISADLHELATG